ncbi:hypothetical protein C3E98_029355, partial [Pseudomonas sp. MWU13-2625]
MTGIYARTVPAIAGQAHIEQSVADIRFTPLYTRVIRRDYGSLLPDLIYGPVNPLMRMRVMAASVMEWALWGPRIEVNQLEFGST